MSAPEAGRGLLTPAPTESTKRTVLVVDDNEALATSLQRVLAQAGFDAIVANNGSKAAQVVMGRPLDAILTDIQMPGMSGVELLRIVRAYDLDLPVILMTGEPTAETAIEAISLGALQYLVKPVANDALVKAVQRAVHLNAIAKMKREALRIAGADDAVAGDRTGLQAQLDNALVTMSLVYQPIVNAKHSRLFGYEVLMRAKEPSLPHPGAVLAAAERLDRVWEVGRRVRTLTAEAFRSAPERVALFVNVHPRDLLDDNLFDQAAPLTQYAHRVILEITERSTIDDVKDIQARVRTLRNVGFRIAIDDLGAGYAGLSSFAALEPEVVKLDMSLIRNVHESGVRQRLVGSLSSLCREIQILVVAEGVETAEERAALQELGCDLLQGYFFARPAPTFVTVTV